VHKTEYMADNEYFPHHTPEELADPDFYEKQLEDEAMSSAIVGAGLGAMAALFFTVSGGSIYTAATHGEAHPSDHSWLFEHPNALYAIGAMGIVAGAALVRVGIKCMNPPENKEFIERHGLVKITDENGKVMYRKPPAEENASDNPAEAQAASLREAYKDQSGLGPEPKGTDAAPILGKPENQDGN